MKLGLVMVALGVVMMVFGCDHRAVSKGAGDKPVDVELTKLVKEGFNGTNRHIKVKGPQLHLYDYSVFEKVDLSYYQKKSGALPSVGHVFTPVVSGDEALFKKVPAAYEKIQFKSDNFKPETDRSVIIRKLKSRQLSLPEHEDFKVLILDTQFENQETIPAYYAKESVFRGMVIPNDQLAEDDRDRIKKRFPALDLAKVVIIERGRKPQSAFMYMMLILGGLLFFGVGIYMLIKLALPDKNLSKMEGDDALTEFAKRRNPHLYE